MRIKSLLLTLTASIIVFILTSCRVNNGDIGPLYGSWVLTEMKVDNEIYTEWKSDGYDNTFFKFQNNICEIMRTNDRLDTDSRVCTWQWVTEDTEIELNFTHTDDRFPEPGGYLYNAPDWLLLDGPGLYKFNVKWNGEKNFVWTTVNNKGQQLAYTLKKTF